MNEPNDELRVFRTLGCCLAGLVLAIACIIGYLASHAAQVPTTYMLYVPLVVHPSCNPQAWKGLAGFEQGAIGASAMCEMHIGSVYQWQGVYSKPYMSAYPLPSIIDQVKSPPSQIAFVGFNGYNCTSADRLSCVADVVRNSGASYLLVGNEPDNSDESAGDNLTPAMYAQRFKVISDTLLTANPQLRLVACNCLWAIGTYRQQFIDAYIAQYGVDPSSAVYAWGYHAYGNVGTHGADVMGNFQQALDWAKGQAGSKPLWITEWGADSTGSKSNTFDASYMPAMCAAILAAGVERAFLFIGNRGVIQASVMDADGGLSEVGRAYADC